MQEPANRRGIGDNEIDDPNRGAAGQTGNQSAGPSVRLRLKLLLLTAMWKAALEKVRVSAELVLIIRRSIRNFTIRLRSFSSG